MAERVTLPARGANATANSVFLILSRHWLIWLNVLLGIWVGTPWLAPVLMHIGATRLASLIYLRYARNAANCLNVPISSLAIG